MWTFCRMPEGRPYVAADPQLAGRQLSYFSGNSHCNIRIEMYTVVSKKWANKVFVTWRHQNKWSILRILSLTHSLSVSEMNMQLSDYRRYTSNASLYTASLNAIVSFLNMNILHDMFELRWAIIVLELICCWVCQWKSVFDEVVKFGGLLNSIALYCVTPPRRAPVVNKWITAMLNVCKVK